MIKWTHKVTAYFASKEKKCPTELDLVRCQIVCAVAIKNPNLFGAERHGSRKDTGEEDKETQTQNVIKTEYQYLLRWFNLHHPDTE